MYIEQLMDRIMRKPEKAREIILAEFGSIRPALDVDYRELLRSLPGEEIPTVLLSLIRYMARYVELEKLGPHPVLNSLNKARTYIQAQFVGSFYERCCLLCLDARFRLIRCVTMATGSTLETPFYLRMVAEETLRTGAKYMILAHNHPSGIARFSMADMQVTSRCIEFLPAFQVVLLDHLLYADKLAVSMRLMNVFPDDKWFQDDPKPDVTRKWFGI